MTRQTTCACGAELVPGRARCNPCHAAYMREWRKAHPEGKNEQNVAARAIARTTLPMRVAARARARQSKARGTLVPQPCLVCGAGNAQMHHVDYDRPLDVTWLCDGHHKGWHRFWRALVLDQFKLWLEGQRASQRAA